MPLARAAAPLLFALVSPLAAAQLTNQDDCANSGVDVVGPGMYPYDTTFATTGAHGQSEASCYKFGTSGISNDIWFTYVATATETTTITTCNTGGHNDPKLACYPGTVPCPVAGSSLDCNDDTCGLQPSITFPVNAGDTFIVQLGSFPNAGGGPGTVEVIQPGPPLLGNTYCSPANPNSTGSPARISALGSPFVANNDLMLMVVDLPPGEFGYFLVGSNQGMFMPPGSQGLICLACSGFQGCAGIGRYNQLGNIIQGPSGSITVDLGALPLTPPMAVQPGEVWNFQCWYRDLGSNNFSDALSITFL